MANTLEPSLNSIISQLDETFEVLVVDDYSTDASREILDRFDKKYDNFRYITKEHNNLAEARNTSFEEANGEYILESLDVDDRYDNGIQDFVEVFHQIDTQLDFDFYLKGDSINMAKRSLLLNTPYRSMNLAEDADLRMRLAQKDSFIWIKHVSFWEPIGYHRSLGEKIETIFEVKVSRFRMGTTLPSIIKWDLLERKKTSKRYPVHLLFIPFAYLAARRRGIYEPIPGFESRYAYEELINDKMTLSEIEKEYDITIDKTKLSEKGVSIFYEI